jgi:exopolyphosphatase/guanosine-5'-triphosphate,3'-diphosphate pyrophosphatase
VSVPPEGRTLAAVDLGSNSFHMVVARARAGGSDFELLDRIKHTVRLRDGLDAQGNLTPEAQARAIGCLEMFGQRLAGLDREDVRAVGTNTLRRARNGLPFLIRARKALGHKIEVISGREEARLIYRGVAHELTGTERRLVVDIGGGSTELIVGEGTEPLGLTSRELGCVSWTQRYFAQGKLRPGAFDRAETEGQLRIRERLGSLTSLGWDQCVGSSGTVRAIGKVVAELGLGPEITPAALDRVREEVCAARTIDRLALPGLSENRRPVFAGGLAVLRAVFQILGIQRMTPARYALREGVLLELMGRLQDRDPREDAVLSLAQRCGVDLPHARSVAATALSLFDAVAAPWALTVHRHRRLLKWAAMLHECGIFVTHSGHHRHGAYLIRHSDLAGFGRQDQALLSALVLCHRRAVSERRIASIYSGRARPVVMLAALLRLSVRLHRSRVDVPRLAVKAREDFIEISLPEGFLKAHPLTRADLQRERSELQDAGLDLRFR